MDSDRKTIGYYQKLNPCNSAHSHLGTSFKLLHIGHPKHNYKITLVIILDINFQLFTAVSFQMKVFFWMFAPCGVLGLFQ